MFLVWCNRARLLPFFLGTRLSLIVECPKNLHCSEQAIWKDVIDATVEVHPQSRTQHILGFGFRCRLLKATSLCHVQSVALFAEVRFVKGG